MDNNNLVAETALGVVVMVAGAAAVTMVGYFTVKLCTKVFGPIKVTVE